MSTASLTTAAQNSGGLKRKRTTQIPLAYSLGLKVPHIGLKVIEKKENSTNKVLKKELKRELKMNQCFDGSHGYEYAVSSL